MNLPALYRLGCGSEFGIISHVVCKNRFASANYAKSARFLVSGRSRFRKPGTRNLDKTLR